MNKYKGTQTEKNLEAAFSGESGARNKYTYFASVAKKEGYEAYILFVIQMKDILNFTPNRRTQPTFCRILREAHRSGVHILAYDCNVWERGMEIDAPVEVIL